MSPWDFRDGGWSKSSFKPGGEVTVTVSPVKNGKPLGRIITVVDPNGKTYGADAGLRGGTYK